MKKISNFIVKGRIFFIIFWSLLLVGAGVLFFFVDINYDTTKYLPGDSDTLVSLEIMEEEFGVINGQANLMFKNVSVKEAIKFKERLNSVDGVLEVMWLDTFIKSVDYEEILGINVEEFLGLLGADDQKLLEQIITALIGFESFGDFEESPLFDTIIGLIPIPIPVDSLNELFTAIKKLLNVKSFYNNNSALFQVMFVEDQYSLQTGESIEELRTLSENLIKNDSKKSFAMSGPAINSHYTRKLTSDEVFKITLYVIPIILIILFIFTNSWIEPVIFIIVIAVTVLINMGTNAMFEDISFLTQSTASLLQLAVTMDYAIFLLHRYTDNRENGMDKLEAMKDALSRSFLPISSSMLTTAAGFAALIFMRYTIGADLAFVMIKGITISILGVFTLMPAIIILFDKLLIKTQHKQFYPKMKTLVKPIFKLRYIIPILVVLISIPAFYVQNNNDFLYGESAMSAGEGTIAKEEMDEIINSFGKSNQIVILLDNHVSETLEKELLTTLERNLAPYEPSIMAMGTIPSFMKDLIPDAFKDQLVGENYNRIIIDIATGDEDEDAFKAISIIDNALISNFNSNQYYVVGGSVAVHEIKETVEQDFLIINILSIGLVFLILLISFRSLLIPILLVLVIELSVWINMAIPFLTGQPLIFIGYIIVSSVQLGATIDYGILLTQNYITYRKEMTKKQAFKEAIVSSSPSILTSGLILASAGYALFVVSSIEGVSSLGRLIGRGALLSTFFVLFLLPQLLYLFDKFIAKTTRKSNFLIEREQAGYSFNENGDLVFTVETKTENLHSLEIEHLLSKYLPEMTFLTSNQKTKQISELNKNYDIDVEFYVNKWTVTFKKDGKAYNNIKKHSKGRFSLYYRILSSEEESVHVEIERAGHLNIYSVTIDGKQYDVFENETLLMPTIEKRDGKLQFAGFYDNEILFDFNEPITRDLTLISSFKEVEDVKKETTEENLEEQHEDEDLEIKVDDEKLKD